MYNRIWVWLFCLFFFNTNSFLSGSHLNKKMWFGPTFFFSQNYPEDLLGETWVDSFLLIYITHL